MPISGQCAERATGAKASAPIVLRQRIANRRLGEIPEPVRHTEILEFYAATEGNVSLYNVEGKVGAIGRVPSFLAHRFPLALVNFDPVTNEPVRDESGFCIRCKPGNVGEAIGRIQMARLVPPRNSRVILTPRSSERKISSRRVRTRRRLVSHRRSDAG